MLPHILFEHLPKVVQSQTMCFDGRPRPFHGRFTRVAADEPN